MWLFSNPFGRTLNLIDLCKYMLTLNVMVAICFKQVGKKTGKDLDCLKKKSTCSQHPKGTQVKWQKVIISWFCMNVSILSLSTFYRTSKLYGSRGCSLWLTVSKLWISSTWVFTRKHIETIDRYVHIKGSSEAYGSHSVKLLLLSVCFLVN